MHALRTKSLLISVVGFLLSANQIQAEPAAPLAGAKRFKVGGLEVELTPDTGTIAFLGPESSALDFTPDEQELKNLRPGFQQLGDVTLRYRRGGEPWRAADRVGFFLNLAGVYYPVERQVAYAAVVAKSPEARAAQVRIGAASACKAWHNGKQIVSSPAWRGCGPDQDKVAVQLVKGDNLFVLKVVNSGSTDWADWGVALRITDAAGKPLENIEYTLPGETAASAGMTSKSR